MNSLEFGFKINLIDELVTFDGGFSTKIVEMLDKYQEETDEFDDVRFILFVMPPDGMVVMLDLDESELLEPDHIN